MINTNPNIEKSHSFGISQLPLYSKMLFIAYLREFMGIHSTTVICIKVFEHNVNELLPGGHIVLVGTAGAGAHVSLVIQIQNLGFQLAVLS